MTTVISFTRLAAFVFSLVAFFSAAQAQNDPFDPVWNTMTQPAGGDSPGCRGCHIAPQPGFGRWFGDTRDEVLSYFVDGPGMFLVAGCRNGRLATALGLVEGQPPFMPRDAPIDGRFWMDCPDAGLTELTDLGNWLDLFCL
jgi:hypothetical protein